MTKHTIETVFGASKKTRASKAGDTIRQGRVESLPLVPDIIELSFDDRADGCCYVMLARAEVGVICRQGPGARPGYNWLCFLPEQHTKPKYAESLEKAKSAMRSAVAAWCDTAGLSAQPLRSRRRAMVGWRAGDE